MVNFTDIQVLHFFLDKIWKLLADQTPSCHCLLQSNQLSNTIRLFGPPCTYINALSNKSLSWEFISRIDVDVNALSVYSGVSNSQNATQFV